MARAVSSTVAVPLIVILVVAGLLVLYEFEPPTILYRLGMSTVSQTSPTQSESTSSATTSHPDVNIGNGSVLISYPPDYTALAGYTLDLINMDRANFSLAPVALSSVISAQQHADSMLFEGYFSHWDVQGFKPYMRYTLLNGTGDVSENVAYEATNLPSFRTTSDVEKAISALESSMMYNDSVCCQDGHRDNILNPLHNLVSIGIAYNSTAVFLTEDFENHYIDFNQSLISQETVRLSGPSSIALHDIQVVLYYDPTPAPLTTDQLSHPPYSGSYGAGTFIGGVVPPCTISCLEYPGAITVKADTWQVTSSTLDIRFRITDFLSVDGPGVYTVYIQQGGQTPGLLLSASFFLS